MKRKLQRYFPVHATTLSGLENILRDVCNPAQQSTNPDGWELIGAPFRERLIQGNWVQVVAYYENVE